MIGCCTLSGQATQASEQAPTPAPTAPAVPASPPFWRTAQRPAFVCTPSSLDSPFVPVDSWVYPAVLRLYSLGFVDTVFLDMRPWPRSSIENMLETVGARIQDAEPGPATDEAADIYEKLLHELHGDGTGPCLRSQGHAHVESAYSVSRIIGGTPLRDSYHLGSTIINDYGRPYENGYNNYSGASGYVAAGRFLIYARGELQAAPSAAGYPAALANQLAAMDGTQFFFNNQNTQTIPLPVSIQATIPAGPIASATYGRLLEAYGSAHVLNHEISIGKQDSWLGPGVGGAMAYSNNAENVYSFQINRVEPLHVPLLSRLTGPFRYEFLVGSLKGHVYPNDPWVHLEKISFRPTKDLEFGFERTAIWGGKDHAPITLHTFLKSFFSVSSPTDGSKFSRNDPGARFGAFDFSYRLPFLRKWLTLYSDSEVHDDVSPADAPRRAAWRPGIYLSHVPGVAKLDLRVEGVSTDPPLSQSVGGQFMYFEEIQRQGYTNKGVLFGDWMGREAKGGQAWATWHFTGNEWFQVSARNQKAAKDFIPGGTTVNDINVQLVKRIGKDFEVNGSFAYERWKAPIYLPGPQSVKSTTIQVTWFPKGKLSF